MQLDDAPGDRKAQARAALLARARAVDLLELLEDALLVLGRDADAGVGHRDQEAAVLDLGPDAHGAGLGELDRVADQVHQHLGEPALVAAPARQVRRHVDLERELLLRRQRLGRAHHVQHQLAHRVVDRRERQLAGLDLGQIEHVVDQAEQMAAVLLDALQHLGIFSGTSP